MLNTPWDTGSDLYRRLVIAALVLTGAGILIAVLGAVTGSNATVFTGIPVLAAGLITHLAGLVVRTRDARRRHQARAPKK
ncbi:putative Co/Zn/Cd cation transporter (cation efflux family) [Arthrobacter sp. CAN_A212]|uniref:hypothetical protein n=1 Tax=unclassified Arthrobacter TaxID=235627 RepID=UPI0018CB5578|nr:hypothetical protein [Arthrobacter sp. CAN_C5]MBP2215637.1 putative Co/Zn/Cd cation transporter (cation efflux family) [Arthrobacter sp. CAN_C5]